MLFSFGHSKGQADKLYNYSTTLPALLRESLLSPFMLEQPCLVGSTSKSLQGCGIGLLSCNVYKMF